MIELRGFGRNSFTQALLRLEPDSSGSTIFSRSVVQTVRTMNFDDLRYPLTQCFEPGVLWEAARLNDEDIASIERLDPQADAPAINALRWLADNLADAPTAQRINLATALVSISRLRLAGDVLDQINLRAVDPRFHYPVANLRFIVSNRADAGAGSNRSFHQMKHAIEAGGVPAVDVLDASSHAIVWFLKTGEVDGELMRWFVQAGLAALEQEVPAAARSAWLRAYAMVPAQLGNADRTRLVMEAAANEATLASEDAQGPWDLNVQKALHESEVKEFLHVHHSPEDALVAARRLIELDPAWPTSYKEAAEVQAWHGDLDAATGLMERAVQLGPPYLLANAQGLAECYRAQGRSVDAAEVLDQILTIDPTARSSAAMWLDLLEGAPHPARAEREALVR